MMTDRRGIPLVPQWPVAGDVIVRAAVAHLLGHKRQRDPLVLAQKAWARDTAVAEIIKGATSPASLTSASALTQSAVADFFTSLGPASAGATVLDRSVKIAFDSYASVTVPGVVSDAANVGFVAEGAPFPVRSLTIGGPTLSPRKLGVLCTFSNETLARSIPDVETIVRTVLSESAALALDVHLFDDVAGDTVRPPGLRYGVSALVASTAPNSAAAMRIDVANLVGSVSQVGGNAPILLVAGPRCAAALRLMLVGPSPGFEVLTAGVLAPAPIGSVGTPNVIAAPARSTWQTDCTSLRLRAVSSCSISSSRTRNSGVGSMALAMAFGAIAITRSSAHVLVRRGSRLARLAEEALRERRDPDSQAPIGICSTTA